MGWSRRPIRRVRKALTHSLLELGFGVTTRRCPSGGFCPLHRGWCFRSHRLGRGRTLYPGNGLGKQMMAYILDALAQMGTERVSLFADPGVVSFYQGQGWILSPRAIAVPSGTPTDQPTDQILQRR